MKNKIYFIAWILLNISVIIGFISCTKMDTLIPRKVLFGNPDKASLKISPDQQMISYLAPLDGVLNVWIAPADDPAAAVSVTKDTLRGIRIYFWAYNNEQIIAKGEVAVNRYDTLTFITAKKVKTDPT